MPHRTCTVDGCEDPHLAKGFCAKHYQRWTKYGTTDDPVYLTAEQRVEHQRAANRRHYQAHGDEVRAAKREHYAANREAAAARNRRWREANPEKCRDLQKAWRDANPERVAELYREWVAANPDKIRDIWAAKDARRRSLIRDTGDGPVRYELILAEHGMTCHLCGEPIESRDDLHFDHVIPLARGGRHVAENIRPSHSWCNLRKGARLPA